MSQKTIHSYKDLTVWQRSMELVEAVYELTDTLPKDEKYGLISQMRRSAVSIPSNIAEGRYRGSRKDYANFLRTAFGSGAELETQLEVCKRIEIGNKKKRSEAGELLTETMKMLNVIIQKVSDTNTN
jgi:four helix bundle protein